MAETSRATGSRYGGVRGYWIKEADQITSSQPKFRDLKLEPQELAVLVYVTDKMLRNSPVALEQYVTRAASEEIAFLTGDSIINGDGSGKPLGILNSGCIVSVAKETGQLAATIVAENIDKMYARMWAPSVNSAVWFINQDVWPQIFNLHRTHGTGGTPMYLRPGEMNSSPNGLLMGRPIVPIEQCQTLGTNGDIIFADLGEYITATKGGVETASSTVGLRTRPGVFVDPGAAAVPVHAAGADIDNSARTATRIDCVEEIRHARILHTSTRR